MFRGTVFLALVCSALILTDNSAKADFVIDLFEQNGMIVIEGSGSIDLDSTIGFNPLGTSNDDHAFNSFGDGSGNLFVGVFPVPSDRYDLNSVSGSGDFSEIGYALSIGGDPTQGIFVNTNPPGGRLFVPEGYVSNTFFEVDAFIDGTTFSDLGFAAGDQTIVFWENNGVQESLTLNWQAVPEPATGIFTLAIALKCIGRRKKRQS